MSGTHVFSELFIHLNWHCHRDQPLIIPSIEPQLFDNLMDRCRQTKGVHLLAVNGTPTHVHMAFQIEPFVLLSKFVGELKGGSSSALNKRFGRIALQWQRGYGAVSFSKKQTPWIVDYIAGQKEHHRAGGTRLNTTLEIGEGFVEHEYQEDGVGES
jgi:REP element-mobilizing transposase RayT